jgi:transposase
LKGFNDMTDKDRERIAVFRYGIIAPLVTESYDEITQNDFYKNASAKVNKDWDGRPYKVSPSTLERWYLHYRKKGLEGLYPLKRSDEGKARKLNDDVIKRIEEIKSSFPLIPSTLIYAKLIEEGIINKKDISLSSVGRFVRDLDFRNNYKVQKDMRRYEKEHINELQGPNIV